MRKNDPIGPLKLSTTKKEPKQKEIMTLTYTDHKT